MISTGRELRVAGVVVLWLGAVAASFAAWENYDATPGESRKPETTTHAPSGKWSLVMYAHPRCGCTQASLNELREILAATHNGLETRVLFVRPRGAGEGWERDELWRDAEAMPGVLVECDTDGSRARSVGATVSGFVVLSAPDGRVAFRGGITKARGRVGDNNGRQAILAILRGDKETTRESRTFGCPLFAAGECCSPERNTCQP